jgi:chemotaxis protein histidine kinase CheA
LSDQDFSAAVRAAFLEEAGELLRLTERHLSGLTAETVEARRKALQELKRVLHTLKGTGAAVGFAGVEAEAHAMEDLLRPVDDPARDLDQAARDRLFHGLDAITDLVTGDPEVAAAAPSAPAQAPEEPPEAATPPTSAPPARGASKPSTDPPAAPAAIEEAGPGDAPVGHELRRDSVVRIRADRLDALHALVGELVVEGLQHEVVARRIHRLQDALGDLHRTYEVLRSELKSLREELPPGRWGEVEATLETMGTQANDAYGLASVAAREAPMVQAQSASSIKALDDSLAELRLVRLQTFLEAFGRPVRDAARTSGCKVRLEVTAGEAEMDHMVLMRLREPLLHLVRNAVVHGIEAPEGRQAKGKPARGTVRLDAVCRGGQAILRIIDDGAGVDQARVRAKALTAGLIAEDTDLDDQVVLDLLTHPGFSTRESVDGLAGRGVGMDVVANSIRNLDGQLTLDNMPGIGAVFTIEVPITASTTSGCRVNVSGRGFGLMMKQVERIVRVAPDDFLDIEGRRLIEVEDTPIPVLPLARLLQLPPPPGRPEGDKQVAVVVQIRRERLALLVDDVPVEQTMVVRSLGRSFAKARLFLGGAVQADHSILPLIHIPELFRLASRGPRANTPLPRHGVRTTRQYQVLAVDDSLAIRTMMRKMLEGAGYKVILANDGAAALSAFETAPDDFDLVITDLEMPHLDGVGLTEGIRGSRRPHTPVVMVTSVGDPEQKRRALEAGADSYVLKSELQERSFVELVGRLSGRNTQRA